VEINITGSGGTWAETSRITFSCDGIKTNSFPVSTLASPSQPSRRHTQPSSLDITN